MTRSYAAPMAVARPTMRIEAERRALTAHEIASLAIGLLLGVVAGAALVVGLRHRPRPEREVRVTVARDAIPRRAATLTDDPFRGWNEPARGGPADVDGIRERQASAAVSQAPAVRTPVRESMPTTLALAGAGGAGSRLVAVPMGGGVNPTFGAIRPVAARSATAVLESHPGPFAAAVDGASGERAGVMAAESGATGASARTDDPSPSAEQGTASPADSAAARPAESGPCDDQRRVADERCEVATRARAEADRAHDTLRAAQRSYDDHLARAEEAARTADPRAVRAAKDAAQQTFRIARANAATAESIDEAARDWLLEINAINGQTRAATAAVAQSQEAARVLSGSLERLSGEADAARITAESADVACLAARQALADCEEASAPEAFDAGQPAMPSGAPGPWSDEPAGAITDGPTALDAGTAPTIFRLLQGDQTALTDVVARLAGDDPDQRSHWRLALTDLVDAILATAIEGSALEFPVDHPFWGPFTLGQSRDILAALASLGYRYDGLGGWQDGRIPSQRDLSLAMGYAGLDPMRIRHWPNEAELFELLSQLRVAAPEYLAVSAGDLTLGELVSMLGRRAEGLAEVWNNWGRIRPLLLEER